MKVTKEIIVQILTILGVLSIPSIICNVLLHRQNKKYKKWDAEKNLKKLDIQKKTIESQFDANSRNLSEDYNNRRFEFDTESEWFNATEKEQGLLQERKNEDLNRIDADISYYQKILGQNGGGYDSGISLGEQNVWRKIKQKFRKLWWSIKIRGIS